MAEERVFLNEQNVFVSNTRIILHGTTYATANITSVAKRWTPASNGCALILIVIGVLAILGSLTAFVGNDQPGGAFMMLLISAAMVAAGWFWSRSVKPIYHVHLASAAAERHGLSSQDQMLVDRVTNAIADAITYRG